jgi:hypothetical protein
MRKFFLMIGFFTVLLSAGIVRASTATHCSRLLERGLVDPALERSLREFEAGGYVGEFFADLVVPAGSRDLTNARRLKDDLEAVGLVVVGVLPGSGDPDSADYIAYITVMAKNKAQVQSLLRFIEDRGLQAQGHSLHFLIQHLGIGHVLAATTGVYAGPIDLETEFREFCLSKNYGPSSFSVAGNLITVELLDMWGPGCRNPIRQPVPTSFTDSDGKVYRVKAQIVGARG